MFDPNGQVQAHSRTAYAAVHPRTDPRPTAVPGTTRRHRLAERLRRVADQLDG